MAILTRGQVFNNGDTVTGTKLMNLVDNASISNIVNSDIDNSAAISDSKLATISTAGKVSGTALTGLASIDASAGVIPAANLPSTGVSSDGTVGNANLLENGDFERWGAGTSVAPEYWVLSGSGASVSQEGSIIKSKSYSAKVTRSGSDADLTQAFQSSKSLIYFRGRVVTFGCWVYATIANKAAIKLSDSAGANSATSSYHTGDSTWQWLSVSLTIGASATTSCLASCIVVSGDTTAYFDGAMLVEGASQFAFTPHPNDQHKIKIGTFTRDLADSSGDVAYTGVGFTPKEITLIATVGSGSTFSGSNGFANLLTNYCQVTNGATTLYEFMNALVGLYTSSTAKQTAVVKTFDADGFTLTWTKTNSPTGTGNFAYIVRG